MSESGPGIKQFEGEKHVKKAPEGVAVGPETKGKRLLAQIQQTENAMALGVAGMSVLTEKIGEIRKMIGIEKPSTEDSSVVAARERIESLKRELAEAEAQLATMSKPELVETPLGGSMSPAPTPKKLEETSVVTPKEPTTSPQEEVAPQSSTPEEQKIIQREQEFEQLLQEGLLRSQSYGAFEAGFVSSANKIGENTYVAANGTIYDPKTHKPITDENILDQFHKQKREFTKFVFKEYEKQRPNAARLIRESVETKLDVQQVARELESTDIAFKQFVREKILEELGGVMGKEELKEIGKGDLQQAVEALIGRLKENLHIQKENRQALKEAEKTDKGGTTSAYSGRFEANGSDKERTLMENFNDYFKKGSTGIVEVLKSKFEEKQKRERQTQEGLSRDMEEPGPTPEERKEARAGLDSAIMRGLEQSARTEGVDEATVGEAKKAAAEEAPGKE
ncbi:MAG: hypothetical protein HZA35_01455 [Parcubacteria group bacterium]|nr:hypothetical protein [Parcubacteria group bacterium]